MSNELYIIITISIIIFSSPYISMVVKLPTTPIEIILGSIAGYIGFLQYDATFYLLSEVGFLYLMFLAGLEVNIKYLLQIPKKLMKDSLLYILFIYILTIIITLLIGVSNLLIVTLPLISVGLIASLKKEYKNEVWLEKAMTIGVIGEIVSIVVLALIDSYIEYGITVDFYMALFSLALFFLFLIVLFTVLKNFFWWFPTFKKFVMPDNDNQERDIRLSMSLFFITLSMMYYLHLEVAFGAFVAGMFLATFFQHKEELFHKLSAFGFGWLIPIFFIYTGMSLDIAKILSDSSIILKALLITASMVFVRVVSSFVFRHYIKENILIALSHSMPLTLLIAVTTLAYHNNSIDVSYYNSFILASILEVILVMVTIKLIINKKKRIAVE
jgi:Kef-type K+ transport system membrane component KefB